ncbi:hypothetical protein [Azospirillum palustre]|nr:hypothetical protein [Azospirillum palustre]
MVDIERGTLISMRSETLLARKFMRFRLSLLVAAVLVTSGCASTAPKAVQTATGEKVSIGYNGAIHQGNGWFVQVTEQDGKWKIVEVTAKPERRWKEENEILWVRRDRKSIEPAFETNMGYKPSVNEIECSPLLDKHTQYDACNSRLTKVNVGRSIGKNVLAAAMTLGMASGTNRGIDHDLIHQIMKDTALLDALTKPEYMDVLKIEDTNQTIIQETRRATINDRTAVLNARLKVPDQVARRLAVTMSQAAYTALRRQEKYRVSQGSPQGIGDLAYTEVAEATASDTHCAMVKGSINIHGYSAQGSLYINPKETRSVSALYCTLDGAPWSETNNAMCMQADGKRICDNYFAVAR